MKFTLNYDLIIRLFLASSVISLAVSYSKIYLFHIMLIIITFTYLVKIINQGGIIQVSKLPTRLHYIFYVMFVWYFISILWSWNVFFSFQYLVYILFGISIILAVIYYSCNVVKQDELYQLLSKVFVVEVFLSLLEVFTNFRLPLSPYSPYAVYFGHTMGFDDNLNMDLIDYLMTRPTGFNWNPNNLASVMSTILPYFLFHSNRYIKYIGSISVLTVIIATASRGNFFAVLVILFLYIFSFNKRRAVVGGMLLLFLLPMFGIVENLLQDTDNKTIQRVLTVATSVQYYVTSDDGGGDSIGVRQQLIKNGINGLIDTYGLGVGAGASQQVQIQADNTHGTTSMHNFWIEILVEGGVPFFITFMLWYLYMICRLYRIGVSARGKLRYYGYASSLSMTAFLLAAISTSSVIYELPMWLMFGFAIATINNYTREKCNLRNLSI
ncbi:MAG: O-antigen ligase family protein [Pelosinus sp.]|nr:O-antigen ligase family protein [Pelosinus sp.]